MMKLIHCADLHLDSRMNTHLNPPKAKERRTELLHTFVRMIEYANEEQVDAILIAGDLFDTRKVSATATTMVLEAIQKNPKLTFYYLRGNHDNNSFIGGLEEVPENLKLFTNEWTYFRPAGEGRQVCIAGVETGEETSTLFCNQLVLNPEEINIVLMHGQEIAGGTQEDCVPLKELRNKGIDYLALGHIHSYRKDALDARGTYCYSGCLEGRGFDECGDHGFVLLQIDTENGEVKSSFVPFASRKLFEVEVDVSACNTTLDVEEVIREKLGGEDIAHKHLVRVVLRGEHDCESEWNLEFLEKQFEESYYFFKVKDKSSLKVDYEAFANDVSLKGEFVRNVMKDTKLTDEEKAMVVRCGICALKGEDF